MAVTLVTIRMGCYASTNRGT